MGKPHYCMNVAAKAGELLVKQLLSFCHKGEKIECTPLISQ